MMTTVENNEWATDFFSQENSLYSGNEKKKSFSHLDVTSRFILLCRKKKEALLSRTRAHVTEDDAHSGRFFSSLAFFAERLR